jgi:hypothetical protein
MELDQKAVAPQGSSLVGWRLACSEAGLPWYWIGAAAETTGRMRQCLHRTSFLAPHPGRDAQA